LTSDNHGVIEAGRAIRPYLADWFAPQDAAALDQGIAALLTGTVAYYVAEIRAGFSDIGQGAFGLWFKFVGENVPYMILPAFVLYAIYVQINYLTRRVAIGDFAAGGGTVVAKTQAGSRVSR